MKCKDKTKHFSETKALVAAVRSTRRYSGFLRVYQCDRCNYWHLTHQKKNKYDATRT